MTAIRKGILDGMMPETGEAAPSILSAFELMLADIQNARRERSRLQPGLSAQMPESTLPGPQHTRGQQQGIPRSQIDAMQLSPQDLKETEDGLRRKGVPILEDQ